MAYKCLLIKSQIEIRDRLSLSLGGKGQPVPWRKGDPCYKVPKSLADLYVCSSVLWKVEIVIYGTGYLTKEISKQTIEDVVRSSCGL